MHSEKILTRRWVVTCLAVGNTRLQAVDTIRVGVKSAVVAAYCEEVASGHVEAYAAYVLVYVPCVAKCGHIKLYEIAVMHEVAAVYVLAFGDMGIFGVGRFKYIGAGSRPHHAVVEVLCVINLVPECSAEIEREVEVAITEAVGERCGELGKTVAYDTLVIVVALCHGYFLAVLVIYKPIAVVVDSRIAECVEITHTFTLFDALY